MDHIRLPSDPAFPPLKVAFLGHEYWGGPFLEYPQRCKITSDDIYGTSGTNTSPDHVASFLQSWIFFGLLEEVLESKIAIENFTYEEEGKKYLTTARLPEIVENWVERCWTTSAGEKLTHYKVCEECLEKAAFTLQKLSAENEPLLELQLSTESHVCLGALVSYLGIATAVAYDHAIPPRGHFAFKDCLTDRMAKTGWCPNEIEYLRGDTDLEAFYYVSNLRKITYQDHDLCTSSKCIANQISPHTYMTSHSEKTCKNSTCKHIGVDQQEMLHILEDGHIPLIQFDRNNSCTPSAMRLVSSENVAGYVAISHVWSDGLGNNDANSLPECQLSYISEAVQALFPGSTEPVPFWIDTICFPLDPPEAYNLAMAKMRATYHDAEQVLVFDKALQSLDSSLLSDEERLVRIYCSGWMRRLWTLQEANLANTLQFQLSDCAFNIDDTLEKVLDQNHRSVSLDSIADLALDFEPAKRRLVDQTRPVMSTEELPDFSADIEDMIRRATSRRVLRQPLKSVPYKGTNRIFWMLRVFLRPRKWIGERASITIMAAALQHRSTSVPTDEPLCLGTLLNLDMEKILLVAEDQRMSQVWTLIGEAGDLAKGAFFAEGPKLKSDSFRWAPATVLDPSNRAVISDSNLYKATLVEEGLHFKSPGFLMTWKKPLLQKFDFRDLRGIWYKVILSEMDHWEVDQDSDSYILNNGSPYPRLLGLVVQDQSAINFALDDPIPSAAVLVAVEKEENDVSFVEIISHATIIRIAEKDVWLYEQIERCYDRGLDHLKPILPQPPDGDCYVGWSAMTLCVDQVCGVSAKYLPPYHEWCCK